MIQGFLAHNAPVAVFVDGDNLGHDHAEAILDEAALHGRLTLRRVYGNMTLAREWGADPRFAAHHATSAGGKNNADIRLVIDAMEHALAGHARVFVIASNDGDFGPLAVRLQELGHLVVGIGGARPARGFEVGCSRFLRLHSKVEVPQPPILPKMNKIESAIIALMVDFDKTTRRIPMAELGPRMFRQHGIKLDGTGSSSWGAYIGKRPHLFAREGRGQKAAAWPSDPLPH